jgi:hypothetical protein
VSLGKQAPVRCRHGRCKCHQVRLVISAEHAWLIITCVKVSWQRLALLACFVLKSALVIAEQVLLITAYDKVSYLLLCGLSVST